MQQDAEKSQIWADLCKTHATEQTRYNSFDDILSDMQQHEDRKIHGCLMNLACFIAPEETVDFEHIVQAPSTFASVGGVLGVVGSNTSNLMATLGSSLVSSSGATTTELTVRDLLKVAEFVSEGGWRKSHRKPIDSREKAEIQVQISACQRTLSFPHDRVLGSLIHQRLSNTPPESNIRVGEQTISMASRSILILDNILRMDAQSVYLALRLIHLISSHARLAVILVLKRRVEQVGLFSLLNTVLVYKQEGLFYFGGARHLEDYCRLVGFPCPPDCHVIDHAWAVMEEFSHTSFSGQASDTRTPYAIRYMQSPLGRHNTNIIAAATKGREAQFSFSRPQSAISNLFRRMFLGGRSEESREYSPEQQVLIQAEAHRQMMVLEQLKIELREAKYQMELRAENLERKQTDLVNEAVWSRMALEHFEDSTARLPEISNLQSMAAELSKSQLEEKPIMYMNLALLLPIAHHREGTDVSSLCAFATGGHVLAVVGPFASVLATLSEAMLSNADGGSNVEGHSSDITVASLFDIIDDQSLASRIEECASVVIGSHVKRTPVNLLVLNSMPAGISPELWFDILVVVRRQIPASRVTVILDAQRPTERKYLFGFFDYLLVFDESGVAYFGAANRLRDYLMLCEMAPPASTHPLEHLIQLIHPNIFSPQAATFASTLTLSHTATTNSHAHTHDQAQEKENLSQQQQQQQQQQDQHTPSSSNTPPPPPTTTTAATRNHTHVQTPQPHVSPAAVFRRSVLASAIRPPVSGF